MSRHQITGDEFDLLAKRAGLKLTAAQRTELLDRCRFLEEIIERVRKPRGDTAEPSHIFPTGALTEPIRR